jgi:hypothetical protein
MHKLGWSALLMALSLMLNIPLIAGGATMQLSSPAFSDGGKIPQPYVMPGAGGQNLSLPLTWSGAPAGAKSFALSMVDPHPVARNWVHWLVVDLPGDAVSLAEGASGRKMPPGAVELENSWGRLGYGGPQPPKGSGDHPYVVTLYALSVPRLQVQAGGGLAGFQRALEGKVLARATITGYYGR